MAVDPQLPLAAPVVAAGTRRSMQANRSRDTKPELAIRSLLHRRGLRYRVSARVRAMSAPASLLADSARCRARRLPEGSRP